MCFLFLKKFLACVELRFVRLLLKDYVMLCYILTWLNKLRCGFPIDAPNGGGKKSYVVSVAAAAVRRSTASRPWVRHWASTKSFTTRRRCFTQMPTIPTSTTRCRPPSPKLTAIQSIFIYLLIKKTRSIWKMLGPFATASRRTPIHQVSLLTHAALSHAACASMSTTTTTTTTTTTRNRGDRYGPIEWAQ